MVCDQIASVINSSVSYAERIFALHTAKSRLASMHEFRQVQHDTTHRFVIREHGSLDKDGNMAEQGEVSAREEGRGRPANPELPAPVALEFLGERQDEVPVEDHCGDRVSATRTSASGVRT